MEALKKINWKAGILYFFIIQAINLVVSFFLTGLISGLAKFIFEPGLAQDILFIILIFVLEAIIKFFIFLGTFKNSKNLRFADFCLSYALTFILRLIFSLVLSFNFISAGASICELGLLIARYLINDNIISMQQVPAVLYLLIFVIFEAFTITIAFGAMALSLHIKKKEHMELHK